MPIIQTEIFPVKITVNIRKNIYSGEVYFDDNVNIVFHHHVTEDEDYYIKTSLCELTTKYQGKGKYFLLVDLRNAPKVGVMITPLDKLDEIYTFTKNQETDKFLASIS
ncbi:MAG: hypothetical protein AAFX80_05620 [Cyanobacteria bacterium J06639_18]